MRQHDTSFGEWTFGSYVLSQSRKEGKEKKETGKGMGPESEATVTPWGVIRT